MGFGGFGAGPFGPLNNQQKISDLPGGATNQPSLRDQFLGRATNEPFGNLGFVPVLSPLSPPASTIQESFATTLSRIELDTTRVQRASQHYNAIKDWLESKLSVEVRQVGSFQRSTKIRPSIINGVPSPIDIDAIVCFGDATFFSAPGFGQTGFDVLKAVHDALIANKTYRVLEPEIDHPVVTLSYASEFFIELVPCFRDRMPPHGWSREPASYLVSDRFGYWQKADYDYDSRYITQSNLDCNFKLVPAIKLLKRFLKNHNVPLKSFQIELLCALVLGPFISTLKEYDVRWEWRHLLSYFLHVAPNFVHSPLVLPGSVSTPTQIESPLFVEAWLKLLQTTCDALLKLPESAQTLNQWREFYGPPFPSE